MSNTSKFAYAVAFQLGWFVCIMAGNSLAVVYTFLFIVAHSIFLKLTLNKVLWFKEILWLLTVFIGGCIVETLVFSGSFLYIKAPSAFFEYLIFPPIWLLTLWLLFALALRTCLSFLFNSPKLTYLMTAIAIPLNYYAGTQLNTEVNLNNPYVLSLAIISLQWILLLWCLIKIKHYYFEDIFNAQ